MKVLLTVISFLSIANYTLANNQLVDRTSIMSKEYHCNNGGTIVLQNTKYGNVKRVNFSKSGSKDMYGFVNFWMMSDKYSGDLTPFRTFPDSSSGIDAVVRPTYAALEITYDGMGLLMSIIPVSSKYEKNAFRCKNY